MSTWLPAALAAAAAGVLTGVPGAGVSRLAVLRGSRAVPSVSAIVPWLAPVAALMIAGPTAALLAAGVVLLVRRTATARRRRAEAATERARALDALSLLAAELGSGRTAADSLGAAAGVATGPSGEALAAAAATARLGGDVVGALRVEDSAVSRELRALAACWQVCVEAGSGLAAAVQRLEEGLRAAETQRRAVAAELAGPRATGQLLAVLPLAGIGLAAALGAHPVRLVLHTTLGLVCLAVGLALDGLGVLWTRRLARGAVP
ncbi:MAG: hypothetical protein JWP11_2895 [Frankiales bacterium]|nr:hypothetical protein [Frankiales bacterium]